MQPDEIYDPYQNLDQRKMCYFKDLLGEVGEI